MLRNEVMASRYIGNHRTRCDRLGDDPALLIVIPTSATDDARDFCAAPNNPRVVTDVDYNVHTTRDPERIASMQARSAFGYVRSEHRLPWLNLVEGFFSKLARSVLRHIRVASKQELKDRLIAAVDYFNRDPVVHTWTYRLDKAA